ncbi:MAG: peptidylprolyl isomerase [Flavobacteriaceae bacterium]|nr:peptidylprolyl isomerase [Flavobacteriaceae bacterium]
MKYLIKPILGILLVLAFGCNQKVEKAEKKETKLKAKPKVQVEKKKKEVAVKTWDSLNAKNVKPFFQEFGKQNKQSIVEISTKFGKIKIRLYNDTPIHRANFLFLTKIEYFNTTVFYRVAKDFVIQGGNSDHFYTIKQRNKYGNYQLEPEFRKNRRHKYGALAAARDWENNPKKLSSPFQFYIVHKRDGAHHLDGEHTVFGEVISGFKTMDRIADVKVGPDEWPISDVHMTIKILE